MKNLGKWTNKEWYHQRFDGAPYFIHWVGEAETIVHPERKKGLDFSVHYCFYELGKADWYILQDDIKRVTKTVLEKVKKDKHYGKKLIKLWSKDEKNYYKMLNEIEKKDLTKLTDTKLLEFNDKCFLSILNRCSSSSIIDGFALGSDEMIAGKIKNAFDNSTLKDKMRFTEVFSTLTAPIHLSFINNAEVELFILAQKIKKEGYSDFFKEKPVNEILKKIKGTKTEKIISKHQKKYYWIRNNYVDDNILGNDYFIEELKKIFSSTINIDLEVKRLKNTPLEHKKAKKELLKKIKLDSELKGLITISEDFTYWQDERKKSSFLTTHYLNKILIEISKRTGIEIDLLKYSTPRELDSVFSGGLKKEELTLRKQNCVYYWDKQGVDCVYGMEADKVKESILGSKDLGQVDDFRGLTASVGKAIGRVKILKSVTEMSKIEQGDILVAVMTRPDYIPAMKKASAIVTDEGGITCHAAIVSRELKIPCIIGTKIATKVLKDGQMVEVNANHGWVKIIKTP
jgi:phosphohistidine swiveling domain-containing protein